MDFSGYLISISCLIAVIYSWYWLSGKQFIRRHSRPVLPYLSALLPETRTDNRIRAYQFQKYIVSKFDPSCYTCIYWRGDRHYNVLFPVSISYPDLEYEYTDNEVTISFAVECKWRQEYQENAIQWASHKQIDHYKQYERESKKTVFIVIGIGGVPDDPLELFIIPLSKIARHLDYLTTDFLNNYRKEKVADNFYINKHSMRLA